jgi:hypothetical protein
MVPPKKEDATVADGQSSTPRPLPTPPLPQAHTGSTFSGSILLQLLAQLLTEP